MLDLDPNPPIRVPVVDLRDWNNEATSARFARSFGEALREFGFVRVRGHQLSPEVIEGAYAASQEFFALSAEVKSSYIVEGSAGQRGYTPFRAESAKDRELPDLKEFWHAGRELDPEHPLQAVYAENVWPKEVSDFRSKIRSLYRSLDSCGDQLLAALAFYLDVGPETFSEMTRDGDTVLRLLHYPALEDNTLLPGAVRAAAHEDINLLTLLISSTSSGLELKLRDGTWLAVNPEPGEIVVDSGDMMSRITGGYIPATTHRVTNPEDHQSDRYSLPFFVHPRPDAMLRVIPHFNRTRGNQAHEDILAGDFLRQRLTALGLS